METIRGFGRTAAALALVAALGACATHSAPAAEDGAEAKASAATPAAKPATAVAPAAPYVWETWPPPGEVASVDRAPPAGDIVEVTCPAQGMSVLELLKMVSDRTGVVIAYDDATNQKLKAAKVQAFGTWRVPRGGLLDLARAVLSYQNMILVPLGSAAAGESWMLLDMANPLLKTRPTWLAENQVLGYADCDGLYVVTSFRIRDTVDTSRVRQALTSLTTQTASIGRIQDVPGGRAVIVGDFAPIVASMKRIVDEMNRIATTPPPPLASQSPAK